MLTVISMFSPYTQWVFGPLSPVNGESGDDLDIDRENDDDGSPGPVDGPSVLTLGTRAQIPTGYMVKTLRSQSTCDSNMPSDQMLSTF